MVPLSHRPKHHEYFFRKTALADPISTLVVGFQLFLAAFDLLVKVVPLKEALGWEKIQFFPILLQLLMVPLSWADQKLPKTIETSHLKSILGQLVLVHIDDVLVSGTIKSC